MEILITGGAGYIGSHTIVEILENTDWTPISVDDHRNSSPETYDRIQKITGKSVKHYTIDLTDKEASRRIFEENNLKGVIHFAALKAVPESVAKPLLYYKNNVGSLVNILDLQKEYGVPHHIFSSSCSVYGNAANSMVTEYTPLAPTESPYAETKVIGERIIKDTLKANEEMTATLLRYFNPVGAHQSGQLGELPLGVPNNLVPYITQTAIGERESLTIFGKDYDTRDGTCIRDYIHVSDIAFAHVKALSVLLEGRQASAVETINLGTGKGVSVKEAVDAFIKVNGVELTHHYGPRRAGDVVAVYADCTKAKELLDWSAERDLDEMMRTAWAWQKHLSA